MHIDGDIKIWTDGHKACARLYADGPEGPIIIQASAPLGPIKKRVARMFAQRGVNIAGDDTAFKATVKHLARRKALRRLKRIAPGAFKKGALGPYLADRELKRRERQRFLLERAGQTFGPKTLGPLPKGRRRRWHGRRWHGLPGSSPNTPPRALLPTTATAATTLTTGARALLPGSASPAPTGGGGYAGPSAPGGGGGGGGGLQESADEKATNEESPQNAPAAPAEDGDPTDGEGAPGDEGDEDTAEDTDGANADEEAEGAEEAGVSGADQSRNFQRNKALRRALARRRLRAALRMLRAARGNPKVRQQIQQLATLAGEGDPKARKTIKVLALAHKLHARARAAAGKAIGVMKAKPKLKPVVAIPAAPPPVPKAPPFVAPTPVPAAPAVDSTKWWDVLSAWRRGMG